MARDNSPKARQQRDLQRKQGRRASHDRILIITEGSKTEPLYFQEIRAHYRLNTAAVGVLHLSGDRLGAQLRTLAPAALREHPGADAS